MYSSLISQSNPDGLKFCPLVSPAEITIKIAFFNSKSYFTVIKKVYNNNNLK